MEELYRTKISDLVLLKGFATEMSSGLVPVRLITSLETTLTINTVKNKGAKLLEMSRMLKVVTHMTILEMILNLNTENYASILMIGIDFNFLKRKFLELIEVLINLLMLGNNRCLQEITIILLTLDNNLKFHLTMVLL